MKFPRFYETNLIFGGVCSSRIRSRIEGEVQTGRNVYLGREVWIDGTAKVTIGNNVSIGPRCAVLTKATDSDRTLVVQSVEIDDNVWIGSGAIIYPDVHVGEGVVVSPGTVVDRNVPSEAVVCGNPATILPNERPVFGERCQQSEAIDNVLQAGRSRILHGFDYRAIRRRIQGMTDDVSIGEEVLIEGAGSVKVEKGVKIGDRVLVTTTHHSHSVKPVGYITSYYQTVFERGCVVEPCAILTPGVTIGEEAIVKAGSVVTRNVPPQSIVQGNPARAVKGKATPSEQNALAQGEFYPFRESLHDAANADFPLVFAEKILKRPLTSFQYVGKEVLVQPASGLHFEGFWENLLAPRVMISADQALKGFTETRAVKLLGDCWLGAGCIILSGVTVHHGAIIGAGAVVCQDVPKNAIVVGNPGYVLKQRQIAQYIHEAEGVMEDLNTKAIHPRRIRAKVLGGLFYFMAA